MYDRKKEGIIKEMEKEARVGGISDRKKKRKEMRERSKQYREMEVDKGEGNKLRDRNKRSNI